MTKSKDKLLLKAKQAHLSEKKLEYLKKTELPDYYFSAAYHLIKKYPEDVLNEFGYELLENIYRKVKELPIKDKTGYLRYRFYYLSYFNKLEDAQELYNIYNFNVFELSLFLHCNFCNESLEVTKEIIENAMQSEDLNLFIRLINFKTDGNLNLPLRLQYAHYLTSLHKGIDVISSYSLSVIIKDAENYNIPLKEAIEYNFAMYEIYKEKIEKKFAEDVPLLFQTFFNDKKNTYENKYIESQKGDEKIEEFLNNLADAVIVLERDYIDTRITRSAKAINFTIQRYSKVKYIKNNDSIKVYPATTPNKLEVVMFLDTFTFYYKGQKGLRPLLLRELYRLNSPNCKIADIISDELFERGSYVFRDIKHSVAKGSKIPPIYVHECIGKKNLNQIFHEKYKYGHLFNWNKGFLWEYYIIMKSIPKVSEMDRNKLLAYKDKINGYSFSSVKSFFISLYSKKLNIESIDNNKYHTICDYIDMSSEQHKKLNINFKSYKKLEQAHDNLVIALDMKNVAPVKIKKNSNFNSLRKILPDNFEWIKSRKRLIIEGNTMHHCVKSYASKITEDKCAIYSIIWQNNPYTIEFTYDKKNKKYILRQLESKYNQGAPYELREYILSLLDGNKKTAYKVMQAYA